jgi:hypothetical protein
MLELQKQRQKAEAGKEDVRFALQKRILESDCHLNSLIFQKPASQKTRIVLSPKNGYTGNIAQVVQRGKKGTTDLQGFPVGMPACPLEIVRWPREQF